MKGQFDLRVLDTKSQNFSEIFRLLFSFHLSLDVKYFVPVVFSGIGTST